MPVLASGCGERVTDRWLSGQKQQTVNLPTHAVYGGSNPPLSTRKTVTSDKRRAKMGFMARHSSRVTEVRGGSNSMVESQPSKLLVAGSIPVSRSMKLSAFSNQHSVPGVSYLNADR